MPKACKERVEAHVHRKVWEAQHIAEEPDDPELTMKPYLNDAVWKSQITKKYYHNGKWEQRRDERDKIKGSWSCCMNSDQASDGCQAVKVDKKKWILSSYT